MVSSDDSGLPAATRNTNVSQYAVNQSNFSATGYTVQKYGYVQQWNFGIQRELPWGFFADVAYVGSHGVQLPQFNTNINQIPDSFIAQAAAQEAAGQTVKIAQKVEILSLWLPFMQYPERSSRSAGIQSCAGASLTGHTRSHSGLNLNGQGCCGSTYNSLQATVNKRFTRGGTLLVAYMNSKLLSNTDTLTSWLEGGVTAASAAFRIGTT